MEVKYFQMPWRQASAGCVIQCHTEGFKEGQTEITVPTMKTTTRKESNRAKHKPGKYNNLKNDGVYMHNDFSSSGAGR